MDESLKIRLLKSVRNDASMRAALSGMMEQTQAEFCAFYTGGKRELAYIMVESRELSPRIPEVREKLKATYRMFTNGASAESEPAEKVYARNNSAHVGYLLGTSKIESYFLVPVMFGSRVRGVLFFGSVRKEAFSRDDIAVFRRLADEGEAKAPLIFRLGGEKEILQRLLHVLPSGSALISPDGRIVSANRAFKEVLRLEGELPETVYEIGSASCFNLHGVWEEFNIVPRDVIDRELTGVCVPERYLSVTWVRLEDLSEDVSSLVLVRDVTASRRQVEAREEMMALVAHELRTPLTALKSSLSILVDLDRRGEARPGVSGHPAHARREKREVEESRRRFLSNAARTVDRLGRLVDSLVDSSAVRIDERPLVLEPRDVRLFLEDISNLFVEPMHKKGIEFAIRVDERTASLTFDRERIEQVIQNLLANSIKHVPTGGSISITASPCIVRCGSVLPAALTGRIPEVAFADLCVRDSGSGIPQIVAENVNAAAGSSDPPARASKGLGLLIAKRLVRFHGGSLVVEEGVEEGSAVHLYLPVDQETARIVQKYRLVEMWIDEMMAKGLTPVLYGVSKESPTPWPEAARSWRPAPVLNPARSEASEDSVLLWPLTEGLALGLTARLELAEDPGSLFPGLEGPAESPVEEREAPTWGGAAAMRAGWAVAPREGAHLNELLSVALERMEGAGTAPQLKGDAQ